MADYSKVISMLFQLVPTSKRWRYKLEEDLVHTSKHLDGVSFHSDWLVIENGSIILRKEYTWDGVTPAFHFFGIWWGVWDGPKGKDGKVVTWKATAVHDAFCQFIGLIKGITKEQTVAVFKELLELSDSPKFISKVYPAFVNYFGPQDWS